MNSPITHKIYILLFALAPMHLLAQLPASCSFNNRMAVAGDSWAQYMYDDGTFGETLSMYGQGDKGAISETYEISILCTGSPGSTDYAVSGSEAHQWANEVNYDYLQNLIDALNANPSVDFVLLSIGGNDILAARSGGGWYKNMDLDVPGSEQALFDTITAHTEYIMDQVWQRASPNINFVISSYDFPNFNVTGSFLGFDFCEQYACPKREDLSRDDNGNGMIDAEELITDAEINGMMDEVEQIRKDMADANSQIFYDNGMGLMHYFYGYDDPQHPSFPSGSTPYPEGSSPYATGGDLNTPTDRDNFRGVSLCGIFGNFPADPIHLDEEGYEYKIKNQFDNIFFETFRGVPDETYWSVGSEDGYVDVLEETATSGGIRIGDGDTGWPFSLNNDFRGILSFDTDPLPDNAEITGASLYMIRSSEFDNPFLHNDRNPVLDIKNGYFGNNPALHWTDGTETADASNVGCFHGLAEADKYAIRIDITAPGLTEINVDGTTQFRVYFDYADWDTEYVNFYDGAGSTALLPPEEERKQNPTQYAYRTVKKIFEADGTIREVELEKGPPIEKQDGYVYQEKIKMAYENDQGDLIVSMQTVVAIEHAGLARYMFETYGAPAGGYAPFLDLTYILAVPVELSRFDAHAIDKTSQLDWITQSENSLEGFYIEHSGDTKNWTDIGFVQSKGESNTTQNYDFNHEDPASDNNYYRLRMTDLDGTEEHSEIKQVAFGIDPQLVTVYPNPFLNQLNFEIDFATAGIATVQINDMLGRVVLEQAIQTQAGLQEYQVIGLDQLATGTYLIRIFDELEVFAGKVVKE